MGTIGLAILTILAIGWTVILATALAVMVHRLKLRRVAAEALVAEWRIRQVTAVAIRNLFDEARNESS